MAYGRRKKGGSALMDLAKRGGARRRAAKKAKEEAAKKKPVSKAARARTEMNTPKGTTLRPIRAVKPPLRKMKGGTNLSARAGQVDPTKRTPKQPTRTAAQRASDKKKLQAEMKKLQGKGGGAGMYAFPGSPKTKTWNKVGSGLRLGGEIGLTAAALAGSGGAAAPALGATRGGRLVLGGLGKAKPALSKAKSVLSKLFKRKSKTKQPSLYEKAQTAKKQQELRKVGGRDKGRTTTPKPGGKKFQERKKLEATQRSKTQQSVIPKKKSATKKSGFKKPEKVTLEILDDLLKARNRRRRN